MVIVEEPLPLVYSLPFFVKGSSELKWPLEIFAVTLTSESSGIVILTQPELDLITEVLGATAKSKVLWPEEDLELSSVISFAVTVMLPELA